MSMSTLPVVVLSVLMVRLLPAESVDCNSTISDLHPAWDPSPWSCRGRCGLTFSGREACACDHLCPVYGDCCADFDQVCPVSSHAETSRSNDSVLSASSHLSASPISVSPGLSRCRSRTRLISVCPVPAKLTLDPALIYKGQRIVRGQVVERCQSVWQEAEDEDVLRMLPITDAVSGLHFANIYCLLCHGARPEAAMPWALRFWLDIKKLRRVYSPEQQDFGQLMTTIKKSATTVATPPEGVIARRCVSRDELMPVTCDCPRLQQLCDTEQDAFVHSGVYLFRNSHCMLCHFVDLKEEIDRIRPPTTDSLSIFSLYRSFDFSVLMRWTYSANDPDTNSVKLSVPDAFTPFPWQTLACNMETSAEGDTLTATGQGETRASNVSELLPQTGHNTHNATAEDALVRDGGADGVAPLEIEQGFGNAGDDHAIVEDDGMISTSVVQEVSTAKTLDPPSVVMKAEEGSASEEINSPRVRKKCQYLACSKVFPMVEGECRYDMRIFMQNTLISCKTTDISTILPSSLSQDTAMQATLRHTLHNRFQAARFHAIVLTVSVERSEAGCFWNITVSVGLSSENVSKSDTWPAGLEIMAHSSFEQVKQRTNLTSDRFFQCNTDFIVEIFTRTPFAEVDDCYQARKHRAPAQAAENRARGFCLGDIALLSLPAAAVIVSRVSNCLLL